MKGFFQGVRKRLDKLSVENLREQYGLALDEMDFFETVLETMRDGVIVYDDQGEITYQNPAAQGLPELNVPLGKASRNETTITYPEEKTLEIRTLPFHRGTLAFIRDVSAERKRTEEELATGAAKSVCDLAAGVAHEIGNPLNAISMNLQLIERDPTDTEAIGICKTQIKRLDGIIRGFLTALRPTKPNLMPGSLADPLTSCLATLKPQLEDRRIQVTIDIPSSLPTVALDRNQMEQVFFNLIKNALEAMADGKSLAIQLQSDDNDVIVKLHDTGVGMDANQLAHLFEPYRTTKAKGTGLGLMITARIIREHGGTIAAESEPGQGTTFIIRIPRIERRIRALK